MGPYDYVGMQGPPTAAQWQGPPIDFSGLAKIPEEMETARQTGIRRAIAGALPQGLGEFQQPDGSYDYNGLVNRMIKVAGPDGAKIADELMGTAFNTQLYPYRSQIAREEFGTQQPEPGGQSTSPGPTAGTGTTGYPAPFAGSRGRPVDSRTETGPNNVVQQSAQNDSGQETLRSLYTGLARGNDVSDLINRFGPRYGGADVPLTAPQIAEATTIFGRNRPTVNATAGTPGGAPTGNAGATGQPPPISNQNAETQNAPISAAEVNRNPGVAQAQPQQPGGGGTATADIGAQPSPGYLAHVNRAQALMDRARKLSFLGPQFKETADRLVTQAQQEMQQAEQDPQYKAQVAGATSLAEKTMAAADTKKNNILAGKNEFDQSERPLLQLAQRVLSTPDVYTGTAGHLALDWDKIKVMFGGDPNYGLMEQMLTKITAQSVLGDINQTKFDAGTAGTAGSRIFKPMIDLVQQAAPGLEGTVAGNRALVEIKLRLGQVKSDLAEMATGYLKSHAYLDNGYDQLVQNYGNKLTLWTKQELDHPNMLGQPIIPEGRRGNKADAIKWGTSMGLGHGDPFRGGDGKQYWMP